MARWIDENHRPKSWQFKCSECGEIAYYPQSNHEKYPSGKKCGYKYCPNCGVKMADRKTEPQRGCDADCNENCAECAKEWQDWKDQMWTEAVIASKDEPQTEKPKIRKRNDKPFRAVWLDDDHNEIGTPQTERAETMSCQECKWWFTDSLKHGGYCQSLLYNHECRYEPEVDCSWK